MTIPALRTSYTDKHTEKQSYPQPDGNCQNRYTVALLPILFQVHLEDKRYTVGTIKQKRQPPQGFVEQAAMFKRDHGPQRSDW